MSFHTECLYTHGSEFGHEIYVQQHELIIHLNEKERRRENVCARAWLEFLIE